MKNKRGEILVENIIFIVLNLIFLTIITVFLLRYSSGVNLLEESYAKQIALIIDSAKPGMQVFLNMEDAFDAAEKKWGKEHINETVRINGNVVYVKLSEKSGQSYSFFNNINTGTYKNGYYDTEDGYIFNFGGYK